MIYYTCRKCFSECIVEGDFPKFYCWCDECDDYAKGFDEEAEDYAADYMGTMIDHVYDRMSDK